MLYGTNLIYNIFLWHHFCIYVGTATYVDYLTFLTLIQSLTHLPCQTQP